MLLGAAAALWRVSAKLFRIPIGIWGADSRREHCVKRRHAFRAKGVHPRQRRYHYCAGAENAAAYSANARVFISESRLPYG